MRISSEGGEGKHVERPAACRSCGAAAWWNGSRRVSVVGKLGEQIEYVAEVVRRRVRCSLWKSCRLRSWTVYEQDSYPHRVFGLKVVVSAVSVVVFGHATHAAAGLAHQCSRRTVGRWKRWISELADPEQLERACTRLQENGLPGGLAVSGVSRAHGCCICSIGWWTCWSHAGCSCPSLAAPWRACSSISSPASGRSST